MKKKKLLIPVIASLVTVLVLSGVSYAYYSAKIKENNKTETVIKSNELNLIFTGTNEITANNMIPGDSFEKTFTVENTSNRAVEYNIYMENITNEFNEDLVYTLEDETGSVISETPLPVTNKDKSYLSTLISIEANAKKTYTLTITFKNTDEPQNDYQGKTFKGTLGIDTTLIDELYQISGQVLKIENENNSVAANDKMVIFSEHQDITIASDGSFVAKNLDVGVHELYYMGSIDASNMTKDEIKNSAICSTTIVIPSNNKIDFKCNNGLKLSIDNFRTSIQKIFEFDYTGSEQTFVVPVTGKYKLETWGAQGGSQLNAADQNGYYSSQRGGYGAYSNGIMYLNRNDILYIVVGGQGGSISARAYAGAGGYNGGAQGGAPYSSGYVGAGGGGGATHIALISGLLRTLNSNLENILMVSGGGGGASWYGGVGDAGGATSTGSTNANPATQTSGYAFGLGQAGKIGFNGRGNCSGTGGGGGGLYGGYAYQHSYSGTDKSIGGAGGSGYIGNSSLTDKAMYCYNCTESTEESTKTVSTTNVSKEPISEYAKQGNGYVRITLLS